MRLRDTLIAAAIAVVLTACAEERSRVDGDGAQGVHPAGMLDPTSDDFHGKELARRAWDFALCAGCHGEDFAGGSSGVSCKDCHEDGPTACDTCHGDPPATAAHPVHLARWACTTCHDVPATWDAPGHILRDGHADPWPPEVRFVGFAAGGTFASGTCGVYCHGQAQPRWTGGPAEAACGTCHRSPPDSHAWTTSCETCHATGAAHVDGQLEVGQACDDCHGSGPLGAPAPDLEGNVFTTARGVGAHRSHLEATHAIAAPVPCATCHAVPTSVAAAGHIDTPAPAEVAAAAGWSPDAGTCSNRCHGTSTPVWTGQGQVWCGSCHGIPPATAAHAPDLTIRDCVTCHSASVDEFGNVKPAAHLDGDVDVDL